MYRLPGCPYLRRMPAAVKWRTGMEQIVIFLAVLAALIVITNLVSKEKKTPKGNCKSCPEYRYCGGGRPRCARRSERNQK